MLPKSIFFPLRKCNTHHKEETVDFRSGDVLIIDNTRCTDTDCSLNNETQEEQQMALEIMNQRKAGQTYRKSGHNPYTNNSTMLRCFLKVPLGFCCGFFEELSSGLLH